MMTLQKGGTKEGRRREEGERRRVKQGVIAFLALPWRREIEVDRQLIPCGKIRIDAACLALDLKKEYLNRVVMAIPW